MIRFFVANFRVLLLMALVLVAPMLAALALSMPGFAQTPTLAQPPRSPLAGIRSWGYQLQKADAGVIAASPYDLVVIDYSKTGEDDEAFTPEDVRRMQVKPDGSRRIVMAYLSIGEAESYRYYWNVDWAEPLRVAEGAITDEDDEEEPAADGKAKKGAGKRAATTAKLRTLRVPRLSAPIWLGRENETWAGNFLVRYWEKSWQNIIFGTPSAYLDRIVAAGFDGVFLDRVDAYTGVTGERDSGKAEMVQFVTALSAHARRLKPGFAILPQNGEDLLAEPGYIAAIDGIAKEDLLFGHPNEGQPNPAAAVATSVERLNLASRANLPVLVVEYVLAKEKTDPLSADLLGKGFIPYFGIRSLDRLVLPEDLKPAAVLAAAAAAAAKSGKASATRSNPVRKIKGKAAAKGGKR